MVQNGESLGKASIFFVGGFEVRLVYFFEEHLVIFYSQPIITNDNVFYLEFFVHFLLPTTIGLCEMGYHENILLDRRIQLPLKDREHIPRTDESISILII